MMVKLLDLVLYRSTIYELKLEVSQMKWWQTSTTFAKGLTTGYATDPLAFVRWHYDKRRNCIYAIDELYEVKCSNRRAA